jgi:hypothetical protein
MSQITTLGGDYTVHLTFLPRGLDEGGVWLIACMPNITDFRTTSHHPNYLRSDDPRAVTCPACKNTTTFKEKVKLAVYSDSKR